MTSALRNRRSTGGLKRAMTMYQENKKLYGSTRRIDEERCDPSQEDYAAGVGFEGDTTTRRQLLVEMDASERESFSAGIYYN